MCLRAAATGDILFMFILWLTLCIVHRDIFWLGHHESYARRATWMLPPFIGALLGIICEQWALAAHRWQYAAMPLLPLLHVGVFPVLQMIVIPVLSLLIVSKSMRAR